MEIVIEILVGLLLLSLLFVLYLISNDDDYYEKEKKSIAESYAMGEYLD